MIWILRVTGQKKKTFRLPLLRNNKQHSICLLFLKLTKGRFAIREERAPLLFSSGKLLENGINIDFPDKGGLTALHVSVIGKKEAVSHLLREGTSPHVKDKDDITPLYYAVQVGAMQTVKLLIKYNADVNHSDNEGWTLLHVAMQRRNRNIAKFLLINGADKTEKIRSERWFVLIFRSKIFGVMEFGNGDKPVKC
ncbi:hypothetical protein Cgig2_010837 [Carnegiea gigantea]|uniref:Ankyrin repeat domain-containing protein n=1 Tax=Carnegiea gigantea TaxID=171969 RepID=A0A9Q1JT36_9CARY|nr:hypothetical protein Cgig2_010837 [Carnegiea gigantea]